MLNPVQLKSIPVQKVRNIFSTAGIFNRQTNKSLKSLTKLLFQANKVIGIGKTPLLVPETEYEYNGYRQRNGGGLLVMYDLDNQRFYTHSNPR